MRGEGGGDVGKYVNRSDGLRRFAMFLMNIKCSDLEILLAPYVLYTYDHPGRPE